MTRLHQIGWLAFLASAVFYAWSGARAGDAFVVVGSVVFGVACVLFLIPHRPSSADARPDPGTGPRSPGDSSPSPVQDD